MRISRSVFLAPALVVASLAYSVQPQRPDPASLLRAADEVLRQVGGLRALNPKGPVKKGVRSREEIRGYLIERIQKENPPDELRIEQRVLAALGLLPEGFDLHQTLVDLLTEQVIGYYDPVVKTFFIADWAPPSLVRPVMAHELVHALQDQHFNVSPFLEKVPGNDDATLARGALLEGDGMMVMLDYVMQPTGATTDQMPDLLPLLQQQASQMKQFRAFAESPRLLQEILMFPYVHGVGFIQAARKKGGWAAVNKVYGDLPRSSEQVIHPEKYLGVRDDPETVNLPDLSAGPLAGWRKVYQNVLGEFVLAQWFQQFGDPEEASAAAAGWDGDQIQAYEGTEGKLALVLLSAWDSDRDAQEFCDGYASLVRARYKTGPPKTERRNITEYSSTWDVAQEKILLQRRGRRVLVAERIPGTSVAALSASRW
ncbi:MAG: hypothetical protein HY652_05640 [Acidobacteria bacterium]|nr:hypothetical protein [Acidobacteriota bacterium]